VIKRAQRIKKKRGLYLNIGKNECINIIKYFQEFYKEDSLKATKRLQQI
jgi:hypothetical protein